MNKIKLPAHLQIIADKLNSNLELKEKFEKQINSKKDYKITEISCDDLFK